MGLKEIMKGLLHLELAPHELGPIKQAIQYDIGVFLQIKEDLDGDDEAGRIREMFKSGQLGAVFLSSGGAKKFGPFFVESAMAPDDRYTIVLCSSMLAYRSASLEKKKIAFDRSIREIGGLLRAVHRDGFTLTNDPNSVNNLLIQKGLWNPKELEIVLGRS